MKSLMEKMAQFNYSPCFPGDCHLFDNFQKALGYHDHSRCLVRNGFGISNLCKNLHAIQCSSFNELRLSNLYSIHNSICHLLITSKREMICHVVPEVWYLHCYQLLSTCDLWMSTHVLSTYSKFSPIDYGSCNTTTVCLFESLGLVNELEDLSCQFCVFLQAKP